MKLNQIVEGKHDRKLQGLYSSGDLSRYRRRLDRVMPVHKRKHSLRVGSTLTDLNQSRDVVDAALFHDYVERGGDIGRTGELLGFSPQTLHLIELMSDENKQEGGDVLTHIQTVLRNPRLSVETKNNLIIIKLADRIDNLNQRLRDRRLSKSYLLRSQELALWLFGHYTGDPEYAQLLRRRLRDFGVKIRKRHVGVLGMLEEQQIMIGLDYERRSLLS